MWREGVKIDSLSLCSHYLRMKFGETDTVIATGSGFIYEYDDIFYLITNGHNITGVNPETGLKLSSHCGFPTIITTKARTIIDGEKVQIGAFLFDIDLYSDKIYQDPLWLIHPQHGYNVDVVAVPIESKMNIHKDVKLFPINKFEFDTKFSPEVSDDAFILGYPFDINGSKELPIWKRATIATEIGIDLDDLPKLLVDTATRSGMSGSPVIYQRSGYHKSLSGKQNEDIIGTIRDFLGIYSGRIGSEDNFKSQLGIVWKKRVIDEILEGRTKGTIDFQKV
jgi:hypothetical protein